MTKQDMVETGWVLGRDESGEFERKVQIAPGYDERGTKDRGGMCHDKIYLITRRAPERTVDGSPLQEAAALRLFAARLHGKHDPTFAKIFDPKDHPFFRPMDIALHACAVPGGRACAHECDYVVSGLCVMPYDSCYQADEIFSSARASGWSGDLLENDSALMEKLLEATEVWTELMKWRDSRAKHWRESPIEHACLHCSEGMVSREFPAVFVERETGPCIPREIWGKDHERLLLYIETVCVDQGGRPNPDRMSCNPLRSPARGGNVRWKVAYSTRLKDGSRVTGHDDWACVDDLIAAGLLRWEGTGASPIFVLTDLGWNVAHHLRRQRAESK